ncbi:MAG: UDP-N-acetylmuramoyl-L-alanine--D-glutamate ligase, partial [Hyphomicrobium denitrificans]|nr:UDP-N-acetylmuramoyl-L-alanine--D-glutamate ligase [Hyphomicrobium denitrificans]
MANTFAQTLDGRVAHVMSGTLDKAVEEAAADAASSNAPMPVVLLSPASASYDQFRDFEQRGDVF